MNERMLRTAHTFHSERQHCRLCETHTIHQMKNECTSEIMKQEKYAFFLEFCCSSLPWRTHSDANQWNVAHNYVRCQRECESSEKKMIVFSVVVGRREWCAAPLACTRHTLSISHLKDEKNKKTNVWPTRGPGNKFIHLPFCRSQPGLLWLVNN